jgi:hypothetical protein
MLLFLWKKKSVNSFSLLIHLNSPCCLTENSDSFHQILTYSYFVDPCVIEYFVIMFPKRSLENILFTLFLLLLLLLLLSGTFLSSNNLRNYSRDQHETFQDDSLAFVDVPNDSHFFWKCMHARARAFEFLHIKTYKTNFFILCSNSFKFKR